MHMWSNRAGWAIRSIPKMGAQRCDALGRDRRLRWVGYHTRCYKLKTHIPVLGPVLYQDILVSSYIPIAYQNATARLRLYKI